MSAKRLSQSRILALIDPDAGVAATIARLRRRAAEAPASFILLVAGGAGRIARAERARALARAAGLDVAETILGDEDPFLALGDALHARPVDEVMSPVGAVPEAIYKHPLTAG
jgi:LmbE family N-acetylglucosaminyl deacetylase